MNKKLLCIFILLFLTTQSKLFAQNYNMGNSNVTTCAGSFYDSGGNSTQYNNNENYTMTFCSANSGQCVRLTFTAFSTESGFDTLFVYNGPNVSSPLIGYYFGTTSPGIVTANTGCLTLRFSSDGTIKGTGWAATVSCVNCPGSCASACSGGPAPSNDDCSTATVLNLPAPTACPANVTTSLVVNGTTLCATSDPNLGALQGCQPSGNGLANPVADVWYRITLVGPVLNINISGGIQTPQVALYNGSSCGTMAGVNCAIGGSGTLNTSFNGLQAGSYWLQVGGSSLSDQCTFTMTITNAYDCAGCVIASSLTATPPPVNGVYMAGQRVNFCYTINNYNQTSMNWLHGVAPIFSQGWDMGTLTTTPAADCNDFLPGGPVTQIPGTWIWNTDTVLSSATNQIFPPGFYFETAAGTPRANPDNNAGNNYGDYNNNNHCTWTFCFSIATLPPGRCIPGASLNVDVDTYGDGESGVWGSLACTQDPITHFFAHLACCSLPVINVTSVNCSGSTATATATGQGTSPWNYVWRNNAGTVIQTANAIAGSNAISGLVAGTYSVTVTDDVGCTSTQSIVVAIPPTLAPTVASTNTICFGGTTGTAGVTPAGGTGPYTYSWAPGASTAQNITGLAAGSYVVTVTDLNGCTATRTATVTQPTPVTSTITAVQPTCGSNNGSATAVPAGGTGPYTYSWSPSGGTGVTATGLGSGNFTVTVTDSRGCTGVSNTNLAAPSAPVAYVSSVTNSSCASPTGNITVAIIGGTSPYIYLWSPSGGVGATANNLQPGTYTCTVTDAAGCSSSATSTIGAPVVITATITGNTPVSCSSSTNGTATALGGNGTAAYTYSWTPSGGNAATATGLAAGNYVVTVTDAVGCTASATTTITAPPVITATVNSTPALCTGTASGTASVIAGGGNGGFTFSWAPSGGSNSSAINLSAGNYTVTVTDATGCTKTATTTITNPTPVTSTTSSVASLCGQSTGSATASGSGGTSPYTYLWSPVVGNAATLLNLAAGSYTVIVSDANNCTTSATVAVGGSAGPTLSNNATTNVSCFGAATGSASVTGAGGTAPLNYQWSPSGGAAASATNLAAGNYVVTVTDASGCTSTTQIAITQPPVLTTVINSSANIICNGGATGAITIAASGGSPTYTYSWTPAGPNSTTNSNLSAGTYTATVTDINGCTATVSTAITQPPALTASTSSTSVLCNGGSNGTASTIGSGGTAPYTYSWSPSGGTAANATNLSPGNYTVTVTDASGCTTSATTTIANPTPVTSTTSSVASLCGQSTGSATASGSGGTSPYTYLWSPVVGNAATLLNLAAGSYTVIVSDANNCTTSATVAVGGSAGPTLSNNATTNVSCFGAATGSASVTGAGGTAPLNYQWSPSGGAAASATNLAAGNYVVTVTDASGCTSTTQIAITQPPVLTTVINSSANIICNGGATGAITIAASGGSPTYTYSWTPAGPNSTTNSNLSAGTYTATVTDINGCTATVSTAITQPPALTASTSSTSVLCNGGSNGTASTIGSGGTAPYTYSWSPSGGTAASATNLSPGNYTVTVTDGSGCTTSATTTIANPAIFSSSIATSANVLCNGGNDGSATVTVNGGTAAYNYLWSPSGGVAATASNLAAGNYSVIVTDLNGCTTTSTIIISQPTLIVANISSNTPITCFGLSDGSASSSASGGTPGYTYLWTPSGGATANATGLAAGNYTVTTTDGNGCTASATTTLSQPPLLTSSIISSSNILCNGGTTGSASVSASGGTAVYSYNWLPSGGTNTTANNLSAGNYTVTTTDVNGCTTSTSILISQPTLLTVATTPTASTCGNANGSASAVPAGGSATYTYSWAPSGGSNALASGLSSGSYTVTVTDNNGCTASSTALVTIIAGPTTNANLVADVTCNGGANGSANVNVVNGTAPFTYTWTPSGGSASSATNLVAGNYSVTVTDANNCTSSSSISISQPALLTTIASSTNVSCNGGNNGTTAVTANGGTAAYSYNWQPGNILTQNLTNQPAANYTVTVTDANGCTSTSQTTISQPSILTATTSTSSTLCFGASNGSASVTPSGGTSGYTYSWFPAGGSAITATGLLAGNYSVTVTDNNGCSITNAVIVAQPTAISLSSLTTAATCGATNGTATATVSGGAGGYSYSWSPSGGNGTVANGLTAGAYTITVTDVNGCTSSSTANVSNIGGPTINAFSTASVSCFGGSNGTANSAVANGTGPFTYSWSPSGGNGSSASNLSAGNYSVSVTDANGCTSVANFVIVEPTVLSAAASSNPATCFGSSNGSASVNVSGGTAGYSYVWLPGNAVISNPTNLPASNYSVTITDANGCTTSSSTSISQPTDLSVNTSFTAALCNGSSDGIAQTLVSGGSPSYSYSWFPSGGNGQNTIGVGAGNYSVTVTDANGCTKSSSVNVTQPSAIVLNTSSTPSTCGASNGTATVIASGGASGYSYNWSPTGGTGATAINIPSNAYTVTVTDANGCTSTSVAAVSSLGGPSISANLTNNVGCYGGSNGSATATVISGNSPYTYTWSPSGGNAATASGLSAGSYSVSISDMNGCTSVTNVIIGEPTLLAAQASALPATCNGSATGSANVNVAGGTVGYAYNWLPGNSGSSNPSGLMAGNYTVTITDANGCTITASTTVNQPPLLTNSITPTPTLCNGSGDGSAVAAPVGGTPGYSFSWFPSGGGAANALNLVAGNYTVTVTDANGCTTSSSSFITQPASIALTTTSTPATCGSANGTANVVVAGGASPYSYSWSPSGGNAAAASSLSAITYTVVVTDANGCTNSKSQSVSNTGGPTITTSINSNVSCNGLNDGSATVNVSSGTAPFSYQWSPSGGNGVNATNLAAGNYAISVTDANGCVSNDNIIIVQPTALALAISSTDANCAGIGGSATVNVFGGTSPYNYSWTNSAATTAAAPNLTGGNYAVTVTDANGCTMSMSTTVNQPTSVTAVASSTPVSCFGGNNGTANVVTSGGAGALTYTWSPSGGSNSVANNLSAGNYSVTVSDASGCATTTNVAVTEPPAISLSTTVTPSACGGSNGGAQATASGGNTPYTFSWSPLGGANQNATNLAAGNYIVTVSDNSGCTSTASALVTNSGGPTVTLNALSDVQCNGGSNGSASINVAGGAGPYTYTWSPSGGNAATASGLSAGSYSVSISDMNGCTSVTNVIIGEPTLLAAQASALPATCNGSATGSANVNVAGGTVGYAYNWLPGNSGSSNPSGLMAGNYTVTITDANGCTITASTTVNQPPLLTNSITPTPTLCNGSGDGSAVAAPVGGTPGYSFSWFPSGGGAANALNLVAGNYTVTVTDANGCTTSSSSFITQPASIALTTTSTPATCGSANGTANVVVAGGASPYSYSWSPSGGNAAAASSLSAITYTVVVTDANGCTNSKSQSVSNTGGPTITTSINSNVSCNGLNDGSATVNVSSGTAPFSYQWSPSGGNGVNATNLAAGNYAISVTDANGCVSNDNIIIVQPTALALAISSTDANCAGIGGSATVNVFGGTSPYNYSWTNSAATTAAAPNLTGGNYAVTVTDANGCTMSMSTTVNQPTSVTAVASSTPVSCFGGNNGTANVVTSGGAGALTYTWSPSGGSNSVANNLSAGNYSVTVSDASGCATTTNVAVTEPPAISLSTTVTPSACGGSNGGAQATASGGNTPYTFSWSPLGGANQNATNLAAGNYIVTVSDNSGCTSTASALVTNSGGPTVTLNALSDVQCNGGSNGSASINVAGGAGPYTYTWSPYGGNSASANNLSAGNFTVNASDANGCISAFNITIAEPSAISAVTTSTPSVCGNANGSATIHGSGGTGSYQYNWTNPVSSDSILNTLSSGNYNVVVTDFSGCTYSTIVNVIATGGANAILQSTNNVACSGGNDGSATISVSGGTAPYAYSWSPSGGNAATGINLIAGNYIVTVSDANNCSTTVNVLINDGATISLTMGSTPAACNGGLDGSANVSASGGTSPYTYHWTGSTSTSNVATNLGIGNYTVLVTDANGCLESDVATVNSATAINLSPVTSDVNCYGNHNGTASLSPVGGTPPYSYVWTGNVSNGSTANNLNGGSYTVIVTDANGCASIANITIQEPPQILLTVTPSTTICIGQNTTISATVSGGNGPFIYSWSNAITDSSQIVSPATSSNYTVSVTDANGCTTGVQTIAVNLNPPLTINASAPLVICEGNTATLNSIATGGNGNYNYSWNNGASIGSSAIVSPVADSTFIVTVTDGCGTPSAQAQVSITVSPSPQVNFGPANMYGCAPLTINFDDRSSTTMGSIFNWNFGDNTLSTIQNPSHTYSEPGIYNVSLQIVNNYGCASTLMINNLVNAYPTPVASFASDPSVTTTLSPTINFVNLSTGATTYSWDFGDGSALNNHFNPDHEYSDTGTYLITLIATNDHGCIDTIRGYVEIGDGFSVYIPNAFTPNHDGVNENFNAYGIGWKDYQLYILDRWGLNIFHSEDKDKPWDGTYEGNGTQCQSDVYIYKIQVHDTRGKLHSFIGHVSLVR